MTDRLVELAAAVEARSTSAASRLHGSEHWRRVALVGRELASRTPGADPLVVALFALFHDAGRLSDGHDPEHGPRGASLAAELCAEWLSTPRLDALAAACRDHDRGMTSPDPTIGACWDADRLNLWRVGITPRPALLSTEAARAPDVVEWARQLQSTPVGTWGDVLDPSAPAAPAAPEIVKLYHGTSAHLESVIAREGLRTLDDVEPFVSQSFQKAAGYAMRAACLHEAEHPGSPMLAVILRVEVPRSDLRADITGDDYAVASGKVEPQHILGVVRRFSVQPIKPEVRASLAANNRYDRDYRSRWGTPATGRPYESETVEWLRARRAAREAQSTEAGLSRHIIGG